MTFSWKKLIRENIKVLKPYSSARDEYKGDLGIFLDANEYPYDNNYNRYPDPEHKELRALIATSKNLPYENMVLGNGSDEIINFLFLATCNHNDNVISISPSYGMYKVSSDILGIEYKEVLLNEDFSLNENKLIAAANENTKLIFICSPNNPTGNLICSEKIIKVAKNTSALVVVDEAYIDFSRKSNANLINEYENICIIQTLSKAYGLAGLRIGILVGSPVLISYIKKIKAPYNIGSLTQKTAIEYLKNINIDKMIEELEHNKQFLITELRKFDFLIKIYPSDANFILIKVKNANDIFNFLISKQIIIRDRSNVILCNDCLRITIGTKNENNSLIENLKLYK